MAAIYITTADKTSLNINFIYIPLRVKTSCTRFNLSILIFKQSIYLRNSEKNQQDILADTANLSDQKKKIFPDKNNFWGVQKGSGEYREYKKAQGSTYSPGEYRWSVCRNHEIANHSKTLQYFLDTVEMLVSPCSYIFRNHIVVFLIILVVVIISQIGLIL